MNKLLTTAIFLALPFLLAAQTPSLSANEDTALEQELTHLARERILLFDKGDPKLWTSYVAPQYFVATPSGVLQSKAEVTAGFRPPLAGYSDDFHFEDVRVAHDGDTAVMTYRIMEKENWDGQKVVTRPLRKTDTYILRDGRWRILASQETFYPAKPARVTVRDDTLARYAGTYRLMRSLSYRVSAEKGKLVLQEVDQPGRTELFPESETTFFAPDDTARYIFVPSTEGRAGRMLIRNNGYDLTAEKTD